MVAIIEGGEVFSGDDVLIETAHFSLSYSGDVTMVRTVSLLEIRDNSIRVVLAVYWERFGVKSFVPLATGGGELLEVDEEGNSVKNKGRFRSIFLG
mmetsp:Transcript_9250/g.11680  ORF Transcript_9250/g.11680 Transcript_9250/m.11680 type:complete len:96 (+) Transcript_9250:471-758(+)